MSLVASIAVLLTVALLWAFSSGLLRFEGYAADRRVS